MTGAPNQTQIAPDTKQAMRRPPSRQLAVAGRSRCGSETRGEVARLGGGRERRGK